MVGASDPSDEPLDFPGGGTAYLFLELQTPEGQAESLIEDVEALPLDNRDSTKLTKSLDRVLKALDKEDTVSACDLLNKFIKDTQKLIDKGNLDPTDGQALIDSANDLKDAIPC